MGWACFALTHSIILYNCIHVCFINATLIHTDAGKSTIGGHLMLVLHVQMHTCIHVHFNYFMQNRFGLLIFLYSTCVVDCLFTLFDMVQLCTQCCINVRVHVRKWT